MKTTAKQDAAREAFDAKVATKRAKAASKAAQDLENYHAGNMTVMELVSFGNRLYD